MNFLKKLKILTLIAVFIFGFIFGSLIFQQEINLSHYNSEYTNKNLLSKDYETLVQNSLSDIDFSFFNKESTIVAYETNENHSIDSLNKINSKALLYTFLNQIKENKKPLFSFLFSESKNIDIPVEDYYLTNKDINLIQSNIAVLKVNNDNSFLLKRAENIINIIKLTAQHDYIELRNKIKNNQFVATTTLDNLLLSIEYEKVDDYNKPIIPISDFITVELIRDYLENRLTCYDGSEVNPKTQTCITE